MIVLILIFLLLIVGFGYWGHDRECDCGELCVTGGLAVFGDVLMEGSPVVEDLASEGTNEFFGVQHQAGSSFSLQVHRRRMPSGTTPGLTM